MPQTIDGRGLPPPEPFELTMAALDTLAIGDELVLILNVRPQPLYRVLQRNGFRWAETAREDGAFEIRISHRGPSGAA
ncbi:MAG: DUF2249 domain-containing protein [Proteobacteria bacterium]|nr:DUF2249 domain-containing protein [Pseudomonadota bacterium]